MKLDFLFVGPQKTGTTWIYEQLKGHPEICFPKDVKETFFFDQYHEKGLDWYKWHFKHQEKGQLIGEVAPTYFDVKEVPERIKGGGKNCQIFITLRSPIEKARSLYHHKMKYGKIGIDTKFFNAVEKVPRIITSAYYRDHIQRWTDVFGDDNIHIFLLDDIKKNPKSTLETIFRNLNIEPRIKEDDLHKKVNESSLPTNKILARLLIKTAIYLRSKRLHKIVEFGKALGINQVFKSKKGKMPSLSDDEKKRLGNIFEPHIDFVEGYLQRDLSQWKNSL